MHSASSAVASLKVKQSSYLFQEIIKNKQCGYDVRKPSYVSIISYFYVIYTSQCMSYVYRFSFEIFTSDVA